MESINSSTRRPAFSGPTLACYAILWAALPAGAAFVDGVEQFTGTTKDATAWYEFLAPGAGGAVVQDDALRFVAGPGEQPWSEYTTRAVRVGIGGSVSVRARLNPGETSAAAYLFLTDDTSGTTGLVGSDHNWLSLSFGLGSPGISSVSGGNGAGIGSSMAGDFTAVAGTWYALEIERLASASARFTVTHSDPARTLIATQTIPVRDIPADLYITLVGAGNGTVSFDDVTVPEPTLASWAGLSVMLAKRRPYRR